MCSSNKATVRSMDMSFATHLGNYMCYRAYEPAPTSYALKVTRRKKPEQTRLELHALTSAPLLAFIQAVVDGNCIMLAKTPRQTMERKRDAQGGANTPADKQRNKDVRLQTYVETTNHTDTVSLF